MLLNYYSIRCVVWKKQQQGRPWLNKHLYALQDSSLELILIWNRSVSWFLRMLTWKHITSFYRTIYHFSSFWASSWPFAQALCCQKWMETKFLFNSVLATCIMYMMYLDWDIQMKTKLSVQYFIKKICIWFSDYPLYKTQSINWFFWFNL